MFYSRRGALLAVMPFIYILISHEALYDRKPFDNVYVLVNIRNVVDEIVLLKISIKFYLNCQNPTQTSAKIPSHVTSVNLIFKHIDVRLHDPT